MNSKLTRRLSIAVTIVAAGVNLLSSVVSKKEQENKIAEECAKAVAEALGNKEN